MNRKLIFLLSIVCLSFYVDAENSESSSRHHNAEWNKFFTDCAVSTTAGILTGAFTAAGCATIDYMFDLHQGRIISWITFSGLRTNLIDSLHTKFDIYKIPHSSLQMQGIAWIADWCFYFYILNTLERSKMLKIG